MAEISQKKRIWGWMFFDWASQPYNTLLLTFVFGPYFAAIVAGHFMGTGLAEEAADAKAQAIWSLGLTITGLVVAFSAPILGALADLSGRRMPYIYFFSVLYVIGAFALWWAFPDASNFWLMLVMFGIGFIGMEFTTIFTNAILPDLGTEDEIGKISGSGFSFGYWGGVLALFIMLLLFVEQGNGKTLIGLDPAFGLVNADAKEGTRLVGPFSAIWFVVSMYFFFAWVKEEPRAPGATPARIGNAIKELVSTLKSLPGRKSLAAYLGSSLLYRDALNGLYGFGGVYATLVLNWSITFVGIFGIIGAISAAFFSWVGGKADQKYGPKPVIVFCIIVLIGVCSIIVGMTRESIFGIPMAEGSQAPDIIFFVCGSIIGAAGGALQAASRTMMVRHADEGKSTEAFGLYALSGKATAFLAPGLITLATVATQSPRLGISPLVLLFVLGLIALVWVNPRGVARD